MNDKLQILVEILKETISKIEVAIAGNSDDKDETATNELVESNDSEIEQLDKEIVDKEEPTEVPE